MRSILLEILDPILCLILWGMAPESGVLAVACLVASMIYVCTLAGESRQYALAGIQVFVYRRISEEEGLGEVYRLIEGLNL